MQGDWDREAAFSAGGTAWQSNGILHSRPGFRQRAHPFCMLRVTPAGHLNLLKRFVASTLENFQNQACSPRGKPTRRGGFMGRSVVLGLASSILLVFLTGCSSSSVTGTGFRTPAGITLSPGSNVSIDVGTTQTFTASAHDASNPPRVLTVPITFHSDNTAVVTVANNGLACAGSWDSLTSPQICTPGQFGVAHITATAQGVSSPPTTVYVHQHVDSVTISPVTPPTNPCVSKGQLFDYEAKALSHGVDITSTVGPFTWTAVNSQVATLSTTASGLTPAQAQATANVPGITKIFASVSGVIGLPTDFITCPVNSITLALSDGTPNSFTVAAHSGAKTVVATVLDTLGAAITGVPLTWSSSQPAVVQVVSTNSSQVTNTASVSFPAAGGAGGAAIVASCSPPTCNITTGFTPSTPIYSSNPLFVTVTQSGTPPAGTVLASSKDCGIIDGCITLIGPISTPTNVAGTATSLPSTPNSMVFGSSQTASNIRAYLGTDSSLSGTRGLMSFDPSAAAGSSVPQFLNQIGEVLAVSPNGNKIVLSDRVSIPNQVFVFDMPTGTSAHFAITGATAADFSADSLKAFIAAGNNLYVYSTQDALQTIPLSFTATGVSYLSDGAFVYVLGASPPTVAVYRTVDDGLAGSFSPPGNPVLIKTTPDGSSVLLLSSPTTGVDIFDVTTSAVNSYNLAQGNFVPTQLLVSTDSTRVFILTSTLPSVLAFNLVDKTPSAITLLGGATAIQAALSLDGTRMYVAASDGMVHILDTVAGLDIQQIAFPVSSNTLQAGLCAGLQAALNITAATQNGASTIYTYTLTSGTPIRVGSQAVITGMADAGNNGTFIITALGAGTFTVDNPSGMTATGQAGGATVMVVCNPELIAVKP